MNIGDYLLLEDFTSRIGGLPSTFKLAVLAPYWKQETETAELLTLLPLNYDFWKSEVTSTYLVEVRKAFTPYMVYAVYSRYIINPAVIFTETGPVYKEVENSTRIEPTDRNSLARYYESLAASAWKTLTNTIHVPEPCKPQRAETSQLSVIVAKKRSNF